MILVTVFTKLGPAPVNLHGQSAQQAMLGSQDKDCWSDSRMLLVGGMSKFHLDQRWLSEDDSVSFRLLVSLDSATMARKQHAEFNTQHRSVGSMLLELFP